MNTHDGISPQDPDFFEEIDTEPDDLFELLSSQKYLDTNYVETMHEYLDDR